MSEKLSPYNDEYEDDIEITLDGYDEDFEMDVSFHEEE